MEGFDFEFEWDFSQLSAIELSKERITLSEIKSVYSNNYSEVYNMPNLDDNYHFHIIGFSNQKRFLNIYAKISNNIQPKINRSCR